MLLIKSGPTLELTVNGLPQDVTRCAHEYLFEAVALDSETTVSDLLTLVKNSPILMAVFRQNLAEELLAEAELGPIGSIHTEPAKELDYIEIGHQWYVNSKEHAYSGMQCLEVRGVSTTLTEDYCHAGQKHLAGSRIQSSIALTPLRELLCLPVRLAEYAVLIDGDRNSDNYAKKIGQATHEGFTLAQVLHSLLYELSFYGTPSQQEALYADLQANAEPVASEEIEYVSMEEFLEGVAESESQSAIESAKANGPKPNRPDTPPADIEAEANDLRRSIAGSILAKVDFGI